MSEDKFKKISKSLSYWLRHHPEDIGIEISSDGWTDIKILLDKAKSKLLFDFNDLKQVVQNNDKKRFSISEDMCRIRANQGHSLTVDLQLLEVLPPSILYHGTPNRNVESILKEGLNRGQRHHVHLSKDEETAAKVGSRRGSFTILKIQALKMRADGYKIYISDNGVYLVDEVPAKYISI
jgi:putative RNA 2'-phosphotransferase